MISHSKHPSLIGLVRVVTEVQTNAYYSVVKGQPDHRYSACNNGKGFRSDIEKASNYRFDGTTITVFDPMKKDGSILYEMEVYEGEHRMTNQTEEMDDNIEERNEIAQEGIGMTL